MFAARLALRAPRLAPVARAFSVQTALRGGSAGHPTILQGPGAPEGTVRPLPPPSCPSLAAPSHSSAISEVSGSFQRAAAGTARVGWLASMVSCVRKEGLTPRSARPLLSFHPEPIFASPARPAPTVRSCRIPAASGRLRSGRYHPYPDLQSTQPVVSPNLSRPSPGSTSSPTFPAAAAAAVRSLLLPRVLGPCAPSQIATDFEQATGVERYQLLGNMAGVDVFDMAPVEVGRMGTLADPIKVNSIVRPGPFPFFSWLARVRARRRGPAAAV